MEIHYHNRSKLNADLEVGAIYHANADDLLPQIGILWLHCPLAPPNSHLRDASLRLK